MPTFSRKWLLGWSRPSVRATGNYFSETPGIWCGDVSISLGEHLRHLRVGSVEELMTSLTTGQRAAFGFFDLEVK